MILPSPIIKTTAAGLLCGLSACSSPPDPAAELAHEGEEKPINQEQFNFIKSECELADASMSKDSFGRRAIRLARVRDNSDMVAMITCVKGKFTDLNARASIQLPDGQMEAPTF